jgi:hypothetical protein
MKAQYCRTLAITAALALATPLVLAEEKGPKDFPAGGLPPEMISEHVNRAMPVYLGCYKDELKKATAPLVGKIVVNFQIGGDGKVIKAAVTSTTLNSSVVEGCVVSALSGLRFPEPAGHIVMDVTYPFSFNAEPLPGAPGKKPRKNSKAAKKEDK